MVHDADKSVVSLMWFDRSHQNADISTTTGFVCFRQDTQRSLFIVSTSHQLTAVFPENISDVPKQNIGVNVKFFDGIINFPGIVVEFDLDKDLTLIMVQVASDVLLSSPLSAVQPVSFSQDPPYARQEIYTIHHPDRVLEQAHFQYSMGFIADPNFQSSGKVHYYMPLIMPSSSGAPVFDKNTNKVVCMIHNSRHVTSWSNERTREIHMGTSVSTIMQFFQDLGILLDMFM